jgi:hypothetical protein
MDPERQISFGPAVETGSSFRLAAIDCAAGEFGEHSRLDMEGDRDEACLWVERRLLSSG